MRLPAFIKPLTVVAAWTLMAPGLTVFAQDKELPEQAGTQWQPYLEWSLENSSCEGNPFDLGAKAVFIHRDTGNVIMTHLFYDGEDTWRFRFTGGLSGSWAFQTFSEDDDLDGWSGEVNITENSNPEAHGFMRAFGDKWGWQGTEEAFIPQYVMGKEPSAYLDAHGSVRTSMIDQDIREFVIEHGFTGFHIPVRGNWFDGDNPDPRIYRVVEQLIQKVHALGGGSHIWLWGSGSGGKDGSGPEALADGPMSDIDRRNLRYLAARLGPVPGWSMGYGFDTENGWAGRQELNEWKSFLEEQMGWDHFLGARVGYDEKGLFAISPRPPRPPHDAAFRSPIADEYTTWLGGDYIGYTSYRPLYARYVQVIYHHSEKPSFEEDRFRLRDSEEWSYKDYNPELTRRGLWHSAMAGGVANIWGNLLPDADQGGSRPYDIKEQIKTYATFFQGRFLKEMMTEYVGPELRLSTPEGTHAIIYREDSDQVRLDLSRMSACLPAIAVDAKAAYREIDLGTLSPEFHTWKAPYRSDWALAVGDFQRSKHR